MSNLPSIPWTERERAQIRGRLIALEAGGGGGGPPGSGSFVLDDGSATAGGTFTIDEGGA